MDLLLFSFPFGVFENPQYERAKGEIAIVFGKFPACPWRAIETENPPPQLAKSFLYLLRVSKKNAPLSAYSVHRGVVGSERKIFKICRKSGQKCPLAQSC